ncbi:MAG: hypothetical protein ACTHNU_11625 [Gaiellales bacterium]
METLHERVCDQCGRQLENGVAHVTRVRLAGGQTRLLVQCQTCEESSAARKVVEPQVR